MTRILAFVCIAALTTAPGSAQDPADSFAGQDHSGLEKVADFFERELMPPMRLEADGEPIDIGAFEGTIAHAGPAIGDVDGDDDLDLLVGDFPGYFWYFENTGDDEAPTYEARGKLQAGPTAAKTPVY